MTQKLVVVPHNIRSSAAKHLADTLTQQLGYKVFRCAPEAVRGRVPFILTGGTDKLTQFRKFHDAGISIPDFTTDRVVAIGWLPNRAVVCRTLLRSSEGRGIVVATTPEEVVPAPLYTQYINKKYEYRVHVLNGDVIDVQIKRRRNGHEGDRDNRIRNLANGYVYCRSEISEPANLRALAVAATKALDYTLGAVDIVHNSHSGFLAVLEVNANPGMEGTTLQNYSVKIIDWYKRLQNGN